MTSYSHPIEALDEFFRVIRRQADADPTFAAELAKAIGVPLKIEVEQKGLTKALPYLDPVIIAGQGLDEFRNVFRPLSDANLRKIIIHFNIADKDSVSAKAGVKGEALLDILWKGAEARRRQVGAA